MSKYNYNTITAQQLLNVLKRPAPEILQIILMIGENSRLHPDQALVISSSELDQIQDLQNLVKGDQTYGCAYARAAWPNVEAYTDRHTGLNILKSNLIFSKDPEPPLTFDGYVLAGGLVTAALSKVQFRDTDADFYPWSNETNPGDRLREIENGYRNFLRDAETFGERILPTPNDEDRIFVRRSQHTTTIEYHTVHLNYQDAGYVFNAPSSYQIIHRGHTSPVSVVVGFDQPCCKCFFDGHEAYATLDAALCILLKINPIDWRRESPTHFQRAFKYMSRGFTVLYPGLPQAIDVGYTIGNTELQFNNNNHYWYQKTIDAGESDYEPYHDANYYHVLYHNLNCIAKGKLENGVITAKTPWEISDPETFMAGRIGGMLKKIATTRYSQKYLGIDFNSEVVDLLFPIVCGSSLTLKDVENEDFDGDLRRLMEIRRRVQSQIRVMEEKYEQGLRKIEEKLQEVKFIMSDPGRQYTCSFQPIRRASAAEFWGPSYIPFDMNVNNRARLTFVAIWYKKRSPYIAALPKDVIKMICRTLDTVYLQSVLNDESS